VALPAAIGAVVGAGLTAVIAGRFGYRPTLIAAFLTIAATFVAMAFLHHQVWHLLLFKVPVGRERLRDGLADVRRAVRGGGAGGPLRPPHRNGPFLTSAGIGSPHP
jgi:MFS family permease